jgi:hypothetical protein
MKRHHEDNPGVDVPLRRSTWHRTTANEAGTPTTLCKYCASFRIPQGLSAAHDAIYTRRVSDMVKAAKRQSPCDLCRFLTSHMSLKISEACVQIKSYMVNSLCISVNTEWPGSARSAQVEIRPNKGQLSLVYDVCKLKKDPTDNGLGVFKGQYPEPHAGVYKSDCLPRIVNSDPLSEATVGLVKDWLLCCRGHSTCKEQKSRPLPTRVIDVRTENPKIIESERLVGSYVALSHCWGSTEDTFSTTTRNITERKTLGLKLSQLPLNFRDAISFTRRLGYEYLWIDSLCIIQQDSQDWRHEAGRMAGYYESATVTLAIADAINCQVGFLGSRRHHNSPPILGEDGELYVLRQSLPGDDDLDLNSYINKRAWTLQERFLSPRIIHFTQGQVVWHCRNSRWAEGYIHDTYSLTAWGNSWSRQIGLYIHKAEHAAVNPTHESYFNFQYATQAWYGCVSEFSTRRLTRASDKLAAIAGLADALSRSELGQYMAGLWEHDLFRSLAWNRLEPEGWSGTQITWIQNNRDQITLIQSTRYQIMRKAARTLAAREYEPPLEYRAPSWSWAAVNGPVEVDERLFHPYAIKLTGWEEVQYEVDRWEEHYGPCLVNPHLLHESDNPYVDTLEGSFIEVSGHCRKLWISTVKLSPEADGPDGPFIKSILFDQAMPEQIYSYLSRPDQLDHVWKELLIFQISKEILGDRLVYALLLEKMQDPDSFKRIGLVKLACYNLCEIPAARKLDISPTYWHPIHRLWFNCKKEDYDTKEWHKDRWTECTLKLF